MNREIKFKAWDKKTKTIKNVMSIDFAKEEVMIELIPSDVMYEFFKTGDIFTGGYVRKMVDVILMQSTGLYDKNGKEIYEGDILSPRDRDVLFVVIWDNDIASFKFKGRYGVYEIDESILSLEIVGNINDNPELLAETK